MKQNAVIRHLQRNFLLIVMGMMTVLLLSAFLVINSSNQRYNDDYYQTRLAAIADRDGFLPQFGGEDSKDQNPVNFRLDAYVAVKLNEDGEIFSIISGSIENLDVTAVSQLVSDILAEKNDAGELSGLAYLIQDKSYGSILVFMDISGQQQMEYRMMAMSGGILLSVWLVIFAVALYLSRLVSRPVAQAFAAQTRFVADASHELRTPLAVINANLAILREKPRKEDGKWMVYIKEETDRMNGLVGSLLTLATMDDPAFRRSDSTFALDELVESCLLPFESLLYEKGIHLALDCEKGLSYTGDFDKLSQMVRILVDNAVKHTPAGGSIVIEARRKGSKRVLTVFNDGEPIPAEDLPRIFDRFYRREFARDRQTGGYGLGLAIAKAIAGLHKGRIYAEPGLEKGARFVVEL